jgi:hypothetical protein
VQGSLQQRRIWLLGWEIAGEGAGISSLILQHADWGDGVAHLGFSEETEQFTSLNEIHDHVQVLRILKRAPERDEEWMFDPLQHFALVIRMFNLLHLHDLLLLQYLDGIVALVVL